MCPMLVFLTSIRIMCTSFICIGDYFNIKYIHQCKWSSVVLLNFAKVLEILTCEFLIIVVFIILYAFVRCNSYYNIVHDKNVLFKFCEILFLVNKYCRTFWRKNIKSNLVIKKACNMTQIILLHMSVYAVFCFNFTEIRTKIVVDNNFRWILLRNNCFFISHLKWYALVYL